MTAGYAPLIRWKFDASGLEPGLAESWEFNEDGSILTLQLRKGVKWSDGHPYTSASFAFYYRLCLDERHKYGPPVWCKVNGIPMEVETPDDYTIVMKFAGPQLACTALAGDRFLVVQPVQHPGTLHDAISPGREPRIHRFHPI